MKIQQPPRFLMNQRKKEKNRNPQTLFINTHLNSKPQQEQKTSVHCMVKNRKRMCKAKDKTSFLLNIKTTELYAAREEKVETYTYRSH